MISIKITFEEEDFHSSQISITLLSDVQNQNSVQFKTNLSFLAQLK